MSKKTKAIASLHPNVSNLLSAAGENVRKARKKRKLTAQRVADSAGISRGTLARLEKGDPSVSLGVLSSVLNVLQLEEDISCIADPKNDHIGNRLWEDALNRVEKHTQSEKDDLDF